MKYLGKNGLRVENNKVWHEGNFDPSSKSDKNHKHTKSEITDFPTSLPANGGNADTVGGKRPGDFTLQSYTDSNIYPVNNVAMVNLGRPTVTEMALIDSQATNKIWFHPIDKMIFEESDDGITFNERSDISDTNKRRLVSGNSNASISIPKGKYFRITIFPRSYVYLNWIYMYFSTTGNRARFKCEKKRDDGDWITHFDYTNSVSCWPGHIFIPHSTIAFSPNSTSGHYNQVRITIATDEQTNTYPNMTLYGLEWWGGYPKGSRDIFSYDEYQNVTFPEELKAKTFKNASGKEVAYQNDIPVKLSELNKDIDFDERYYTKSETYTKTEVNTKLDSKVDNSRVLTDVPANAKFTDTIYTHPSTHPASMITESTTKRFVSDAEKNNWNSKAEISDIPTKVSQLVNDKNYVTQAELGDAGYGDMLKSIYDKNNNGIVDNAEKVNGFTVETNVPANAKFTDTIYTHPSTHPVSMITGLHNAAINGIADKLSIVDTRSVNSPPSYYFGQGKNMFWEFKYRSSVGNPPANASASGTYAFILTIIGWGDSSGGYPVQVSVGGKNMAIRQGISTTAWGSWHVLANTEDLPTKLSDLQIDTDIDKTYLDDTVSESNAPNSFKNGITISNNGTNRFPTIGEWGMCITYKPVGERTVQTYITKDGALWARRASSSTAWAKWRNNSKTYHVGATPPSDNNLLWIDTSL